MDKGTDLLFHYDTPLGPVTAASCGDALTGLWFDGQKHFGAGLGPAEEGSLSPLFIQVGDWLELYFSGRDPGSVPKLLLRGTDFQRGVWELLLTVPYGKTASYGQIAALAAEKTGRPVSARAVGGAVGRNPVSLIVPCHRIVGADGSLTGYAGGLERKRKLLEMEKTGVPPV